MRIVVFRRLLVMAAVLATLGCSASPRYTSTVPTRSGSSGSGQKRVQEGVASYYADDFHGRKTANGERFDMHAITAAHKELPFNSRVMVTNLDNGKKVVVRINDRGPFIKGRIIDLSYGAAKKIGMIGPGTARVRLEVIEMGDG